MNLLNEYKPYLIRNGFAAIGSIVLISNTPTTGMVESFLTLLIVFLMIVFITSHVELIWRFFIQKKLNDNNPLKKRSNIASDSNLAEIT